MYRLYRRALIKNYLLSLVRNAVRDKFFTLLNLLGLAVGITASILIFIYIQDQVTFDRHNEHFERIYRLEGDFYINEKQDLIAIVQIPLAPTLKDEYPEVEEYARILPQPSLYFEKEEDTFKEDSIAFADSIRKWSCQNFRTFTISIWPNWVNRLRLPLILESLPWEMFIFRRTSSPTIARRGI